MKNRIINKKYFAGLLSLTLIASSCSDDALDRVNRNRNNPEDVYAKFILPDVMTATAFSVAAGDNSLYSSIYVEHEAGVHNQTFNAETRTGEPTLATTNNNAWNAIYQNIKSAKFAIQKTSEGGIEAGNAVTNGIAKVLLAYNLAVATDLFGDTPYSETGIMTPDGLPMYMQPKIEKQSDLYVEVNKLLDEAIAGLAGSDAGVSGAIGAQDLIYGGSKTAWTKAAYGLKARYLMHTLRISANRNGDLADILEYIDNSFTSTDEEMKFAHYNGVSAVNPLFGYSNARDGIGASKSLVTKFSEFKDPRGGQFGLWNARGSAVDPISLAKALEEAAPNGSPDQVQYTYPISFTGYAYTAPTMLLSYHELLFLKAEALARLGKTVEAKTALDEAIVVAFANLERSVNAGVEYVASAAPDIDLSEASAKAYIKSSVDARFKENALKEIMVQKYLAFAGASGESTETFNDIRRMKALGEDFIVLANPLNATQFPLRFPYGNSDVSANQAVKAAYGNGQYVYSEPVWWAGGTR